MLFEVNWCVAQINIPMKVSRDFSNFTMIDSGNIRITYALNAVDINNPETYDDMQRLDIGTYLSKYYSYYIFNSDSLVSDWVKKHPDSKTIPFRLGPEGKLKGWFEYVSSEYFKNFKTNTLTEYVCMPTQIPNKQCSEEIPVQNWKIQNETLTMLNYSCQKATCEFRGRKYTAWFTPDIPINNGPWKFGGLPGLIMKVYDSDNLFVYECIGIEYFNKKYPILSYDYSNYKNITHKKILQLYKDIHENYMGLAGAVLYDNNGEIVTPKRGKKYFPMELE